MPRTVAPLTDARLWRALKGRCHPDAGGGHDLFVFASALQEHVGACTALEAPNVPSEARRARQDEPGEASPARVPYDPALAYPDEFALLTLRALSVGRHAEEPHRAVLGLLINCPADDHGRAAAKQGRGATYKQLALIAHLATMSKAERMAWYAVAESIPLSERHASHIIGRLKGR